MSSGPGPRILYTCSGCSALSSYEEQYEREDMHYPYSAALRTVYRCDQTGADIGTQPFTPSWCPFLPEGK